MLRMNRVVCAVLVCAVVSVAFGAARRITSFETFAPESIDADGMAIINYVTGEDKTVAQVILSGFDFNETYVVIIGSAGQMVPDRTDPDAIMLLLSTPNNTIIAGEDGSVQADDTGHVTVHLSNAPGDGDSSLDAVGVCTLADWKARVTNSVGEIRASIRAFAR